VNEILGLRLTTIHNLHFYLTLITRIREAINREEFDSFKRDFLTKFESSLSD
ncbi:MAG: tRNA guanosine(34) transglycosylase Tgt, partial [candidate division Zixibacteria bacterium]|nr:tRNA guanosine(34) transglycosylase Tgt [candidate division Zixibacteria bacterium]